MSDSPDPIEAPPVQTDAPPTVAYQRHAEAPRSTVMDRMIPTQNPNALIGYYIGLFSIMPAFGLIMGPAGIILGSKGLKAIRQTPGLPGKGHAITAVVGGIIGSLINYGIAAILVIALLEPKPH